MGAAASVAVCEAVDAASSVSVGDETGRGVSDATMLVADPVTASGLNAGVREEFTDGIAVGEVVVDPGTGDGGVGLWSKNKKPPAGRSPQWT